MRFIRCLHEESAMAETIEEIIIREFRQLLDKPVGARFYKANLHVHTAESPDWNSQPNQSIRSEDLTPDRIIQAAVQAGLDMIAITDHNSVGWVRGVMEAARCLQRNEGGDLTVLPGVEIHTHEGVHIQGIFDPAKPIAELELMLTNLGLSGKGSLKESTHKRIIVNDVMQRIRDEGGVVVAPHAKSTNGILRLKGDQQDELLNSGLIDLIALHDKDVVYLPNEDRYIPRGKDPERIRARHAYINVSDCHRLEDIGDGVTWLLLGDRSAQGLKQVVCEPRTRVSRTEPPGPAHSAILGVSIEGGYFDGQFLKFSDRFTAIIGGNYSGKSAVFDFVRFALEDIPPTETSCRRHYKRLGGILQKGSTVRVYFIVDNQHFVSVRTLEFSLNAVGDEIACLEGKAQVYQFSEGRLIPLDQRLQIELYEQGEVSRIREQSANQLSLIDRQQGIDR
jgi:hypothetical protein